MRWIFFFSILSLMTCHRPSIEKRPNVVLILTDDQGWGDLSLHGNELLHTPHLDQLAKDGAQFERFYVSPVCAPTRASMLTGRYHLRTGTSWVTHRKEVMRTEEKTIAEYLKAAGYATALFGKWHNGAQYPNDPNGQGFDEFLGFTSGHWNNYFNTELQHNKTSVQTEGYLSDVLTTRSMQFIANHQDAPFFCYLSLNTPHSPFQVPDAYFDKFKAKGLNDKDACVYGMVENIDDNIGRLLAHLDQLGISENTIVLFLTDNGPNGHRYNGGMKGIKAQVDEGGVRVPCFIRWPEKIAAGTHIQALSAHIDLLPTLMDMLDIEAETDRVIDGRSLWPLLRGEQLNWEERPIFSIQANGALRSFPSSMRTDQYRIVWNHQNEVSLYDMLSDPEQKQDIAAQHPSLIDSFSRIHQRWFSDVTSQGIQPIPIPVGYETAPIVYCHAPDARLSKNLQFKGGMGWANDWILNWSERQDTASWMLDVRQAGIYQMSIGYNLKENSKPPSIHLFTDSASLKTPLERVFWSDYFPSPDRVKRGEVYEKKWAEYDIGVLSLEDGQQAIHLQALIADSTALEVKYLKLEKQ